MFAPMVGQTRREPLPSRSTNAFIHISCHCLDVCPHRVVSPVAAMKIWVDADACPVAIKEMLFRAADRRGVRVTLVANQVLRVPPSPNIEMLKVGSGFDIADNAIVVRVGAGELVITSDIPLAAEVVERGATALSPRGEVYTEDNIRDRLTMRDFMDTLRGSGIATGGPPPLSQADRQAFANALDRWITRVQAGP